MATSQKADLEPHGLTDAQLTNLSNLCLQLDGSIDDAGAQVENRDLETQDRITKGNALYTGAMKLASIGKSIFEDTDEARYNDYVIIGGNGRGTDDDGPTDDGTPPDAPAGGPPPAVK